MTRPEPDEDTGSPEEHHPGLVEFAVILVLIAIVALVALVLLDDALADLLAIVGERVE